MAIKLLEPKFIFNGYCPGQGWIQGSLVWSNKEQQYYIVTHDEYELWWDVDYGSVHLIQQPQQQEEE